MPNGQPGSKRSGSIGLIIAVIVIAVVGWAWGYGGYHWGTWWNKNTSNQAADTTPNSGAPGAASNTTQQQEDRQAQHSQEQQSQELPTQHPSNQQAQQSNTNQTPQNPSNTNQALKNPNNLNQEVQNPSNTNQAPQNPRNDEQPISPNKLSRNEIRQVQQALDKNGFRAGRIDGQWGPKTSDAIKHFQQSKNIQATGQLDQQTLSDLGLNGSQFAQRKENNSSRTR